MVFPKPEAGETKRLPAPALKGDSGVNMAGEAVFAGGCLFDQLMGEDEVSHFHHFIPDVDTIFLIPGCREDVVVPFDEDEVRRIQVLPPFFKQPVFSIVAAVKKIAYYYYSTGFEERYLMGKPLHIFLHYRIGYPDAVVSEMPRFSEVQIRQYEASLLLPKDGFVRRQEECLVEDAMGEEVQGKLKVKS